jgi:bacterioferritin
MTTTNTKTLENLQRGLSMELTAMHQYQLHACVLDDWGMGLLATKMRQELQEELGHSEDFLVRLLFLKGDPQLTLEKTPVRAATLKEMFETDLADERQAIDFYTAASIQASEDRDIGTRQLFERIAVDEEGHASWIELQIDLLNRMGEPAYIAKHMSMDAAE